MIFSAAEGYMVCYVLSEILRLSVVDLYLRFVGYIIILKKPCTARVTNAGAYVYFLCCISVRYDVVVFSRPFCSFLFFKVFLNAVFRHVCATYFQH